MLERSLEATVNEVDAGNLSCSHRHVCLALGRRKNRRLGLRDYDEES
jgi:hypothetical protein